MSRNELTETQLDLRYTLLAWFILFIAFLLFTPYARDLDDDPYKEMQRQNVWEGKGESILSKF